MHLGILFVFIGALFFLKNTGLIDPSIVDWALLWPIILICAGIFLITKQYRMAHTCEWCHEHCEHCKKK